MARGNRTSPTGRLISVAMIARNEAANLVRAAESARRFASEIVLVDTGSTDGTQEQAKALGMRVKEFRWRHDFAEARNYSFSRCRCPYIFWQDVDETVPEEDVPRLLQLAEAGLKHAPPVDQFVLPTILNGTYRPPERDYPGYGPGFVVQKPRMVRRGRMSWKWPVHENLTCAGDLYTCDGEVRVFNHGNAGAETPEYYHAIMVLALRDHPDEPHFALYLAEYDLVRDLNPSAALRRLAGIDVERLAGGEQTEKYWLLVGGAYKATAVFAHERGLAEEAQAAAQKATDAFMRCTGFRGPLDAASMFLFLGNRATFDDITSAVLKDEPGELRAQYYQRFSEGEADDGRLNDKVGRFLNLVREGAVNFETAYRMATEGARTEVEIQVAANWEEAIQGRKVVVVVPYRCPPDVPERRRNLEACLQALGQQDVDPQIWELYLVEQAEEQGKPLEGLPDQTAACLFDRSYEPFNRGKALNFGVSHAGVSGQDLVCLLDADILVDEGWLRRCLQHITLEGARMCLPYSRAIYMDEMTTRRVVSVGRVEDPEEQGVVSGETFHSQGGAIWVTAEFYEELGGHDERFVGWGSADRDFHQRAVEALGKPPLRIPQPLFHMWHQKPDESRAQANSALFAEAHPETTEAEAARQ